MIKIKRLGFTAALSTAGLFAMLAGIHCGGADGSTGSSDGPSGGDGPSDLPGDAAGEGTEVVPYTAPGGDPPDCSSVTTAQVSVPWVSQKLSSIPSWTGNMCCGPAAVTMAMGYAQGKQVTEDDLKATIDWMDGNLQNWSTNGYKCDPGGTNSDEVLQVIRNYSSLSAKAVHSEWCSLLGLLDGEHVVIFHGDTQGSNSSTTFKAGQSHWLVLERVEGGYAYVDDPGRSNASQGDSHKFTVDSVRQRYEARGKLALVVDTGCQLNCNGKTCGSDGCGGTCGNCGSGFVCNAAGSCVDNGSCPLGYTEQFQVLDYVHPNFGPVGCSGDNTLKLKAAAKMKDAATLQIYVRKEDDTPFTSPSTLTLYVGTGPTCPNPPNEDKISQPVVLNEVDQIIELTVDPYGAPWALDETKTFWVGKDEGVYQSFRATGTVSVRRTCIP